MHMQVCAKTYKSMKPELSLFLVIQVFVQVQEGNKINAVMHAVLYLIHSQNNDRSRSSTVC